MAIQKVMILEFAPTADEIWYISQNERDGYTHYDAQKGLVSILDTAHHAKQRPEIVTTYAGGKATNVARVLDRLLPDQGGPHVELATFLPPPEGPLRELEFGGARGIPLRPSTPAGIQIQCLQIMGLHTVIPRFEIVNELQETGKMQTTRRCIEIMLGEGGGSLNFSPRIIWSQKAAEAVASRVAEIAYDADLVVMAGSPPVWESPDGVNLTSCTFYAKIIDSLEPGCQVSIDTRGRYLRDCLMGHNPPRFAFMNTDEFSELSDLWIDPGVKSFSGTLLVHNEQGCWVWDGKLPARHNPFSEAEYFPSIPVDTICSTIGAGDAMHAGFLKHWICNEKQQDASARLGRSVVYSQVVAAASVSNEKATHGIDAQRVEKDFSNFFTKKVSKFQ